MEGRGNDFCCSALQPRSIMYDETILLQAMQRSYPLFPSSHISCYKSCYNHADFFELPLEELLRAPGALTISGREKKTLGQSKTYSSCLSFRQ
jgi:hypothetical protein